ncbi:MAG: T9SS type A sorting domain-containing protein [Bacteroidia bacterium]|nr:T9SS type A sorting domain-containing protein [Bacteroidia bacterium]
MKKLLLSFFILSGTMLFAQNPIPNPGFENWSSGDPDGWDTPNIFTLTPITQSGDVHGGASAARLEVLDDDGSAYPPIMNTNSISISQNYQVFSFYSKTNLIGGDALIASVILKKNGTPVSVNNFSVTSNTNVYTQRSYTLSYFQPVSGVANELELQIGISGALIFPTVGSNALIDDLSISGNLVTGVREEVKITDALLGNPQPNPSSGLTLLPFTLSSKTKVVMELMSLDGKKLKEVLNEELEPGRYKAECAVEDLPEGLYLIKLSADGKSLYTKLIVQ